MKEALRLAHQIGKRKTLTGKKKAVLQWCEVIKKMFKHAHRVAPEKTESSARSGALHFKAEMEVNMKDKLISKEKLFSFDDKNGQRTTVFLKLYENCEPVIETEIGIFKKRVGNNFCLKTLFQITPIDREISQVFSDGPDFDTLDKEHVKRAAQEALTKFDGSLGHLEIVWVPNNPNVPF